MGNELVIVVNQTLLPVVNLPVSQRNVTIVLSKSRQLRNEESRIARYCNTTKCLVYIFNF